ncbi:hypothetical protein TNCV_1730281 [Trichonephila clavipes]|nr:hypothetical protein TNCV_1730281 [Trichonephila clavipes]
MDADSDDENEIDSAAPVTTSSEMRNIRKSMRNYLDAHSNEMPDRTITRLFEEIRRLNVYLNSVKLEEWGNQHGEIDKRWVKIFNHFPKMSTFHMKISLFLLNFRCAVQELMQQLKEFFQLVLIFGQVRNQD